MVLVADHPGAEPIAEQMAVAAVTLVEGLRVASVQALHPVGKALAPCLDEQMEVIVEKDPGDAVPRVVADRAAHELGPVVAIVVVADDVLPSDAAGRDVEDAVGGKHAARLTGHAATLAAPVLEAGRSRRIVALWCVFRFKGHVVNRHAGGLSPRGAVPRPESACPGTVPVPASQVAPTPGGRGD